MARTGSRHHMPNTHQGTHYATWPHLKANCGLSCAVDENRLRADAAKLASTLLAHAQWTTKGTAQL